MSSLSRALLPLLFSALCATACGSHPAAEDHDGGGVDAGHPDAGKPDGGADSGPCQTNFHRCDGACVFNNDPSTCGTSCTPCLSVAGAQTTCDGVQCGYQCESGYHVCGASCVVIDQNSCGPACHTCPDAGPNGTAVCLQGTTCAVSCNDGMTCASGSCGGSLAASCASDDECCSGHCNPTNDGCCAEPGTPCNSASDCNDNLCGSGQTLMKCPDGICCIGAGLACTSASDCCSGNCASGTCVDLDGG